MEEAGFPAISSGVMGGHLETLSTLRKSLDDNFREELRAEGGLYQFLFVQEANILKPVVEKLLRYFEANSSTFLINDQRLGITLQDVLFICHLPIDGKPVLIEHCPSDEAFKRVYPEVPHDKKRNMHSYQEVACKTNFSSKQRKVVILMIILQAFVMPSFDGNSIPRAYVSLLEDVDSVSNYAWGAAILSFLLSGIENFRINTKKHLEGNFWVVLNSKTLACYRIKPLKQDDFPCPIFWFINSINKMSHNHRKSYDSVDNVLANLTEGDIRFFPYDAEKLPTELKSNALLASKVIPIFCNNLVVHHKPHLVAKQFGLNAADFVNCFDFLEYQIKIKANLGPFGHNYFEDYKKEIILWNRCECLFNYQMPELNLRSKLIGIPSESGDGPNTSAEGSSRSRRPATPSEPGSSYHRSGPTISGPSRLRISPSESRRSPFGENR